ncbi:hypothetical protein TH61_12970 [Rufibacter sp. DG15C]|uniref:PRC-barrel domain-containing protein n=1 Tax=Rufibacter sp. DG15C TaxID=1379909 RepID=UPI00078D499D|nr:PRC-barrel domain-containing protein [Rufibacter sp. DG15C]AMM51908.1 hypothetical protein TH61_12970 [Rufibacter sp. DG15C]
MENSGYSSGKYHLQELGDSQYEIAKGESDIRGWDVVDLQNQFIGRVQELVYDQEAQKVRYAVLDLEGNQVNLALRLVLVPVGMTELELETRMVILSKVSLSQLQALPPYERGQLIQQVETRVLRVFAGEPSIQIEQNRNQPLTNTTDIVGTAPHDSDTQFTDQHFPQQIPFEHHFTDADFGSFKDGTIDLTEKMEVATVTKVPYVVEEIEVGKEVQVQEETIHETVRRTEMKTENLTNPLLQRGRP